MDFDNNSLYSARTMTGQGLPAESLGQIDQYTLVRKLGGGGFGVVYLAHDNVSGVDVALKTLHPLLKSSPEEMGLLREKFALVSRLSHPNIATALILHPVQGASFSSDEVRREMRLSPGDSIMVMRFAPGVTLSKWRRQFSDGVVPLGEVLEVVRQVASALDYAHGEKIVHRDIKPANIMVETIAPSKIRIRILDFGLAAEIRSSMSRISTEVGDTSGTRPYMAPEQWLGRKQDGRADQYALACVAYELLSGAPPFAGVFETGDPIIMRASVERDVPEEIENVPVHVNAALMRALAKNPSDRFGSCMEFAEALANGKFENGKGETNSEVEPSAGQTNTKAESGKRRGGHSARLRLNRENPLRETDGRDTGQSSSSAFPGAEDVLLMLQDNPISILRRFCVGRWCLKALVALRRIRKWWLPGKNIPLIEEKDDVFYFSRPFRIFTWVIFIIGVGSLLLSFGNPSFLITVGQALGLASLITSIRMVLRAIRLVRGGVFKRVDEIGIEFQRSRGFLLCVSHAIWCGLFSPLRQTDFFFEGSSVFSLILFPLVFRYLAAQVLWRSPQPKWRLMAKVMLSHVVLTFPLAVLLIDDPSSSGYYLLYVGSLIEFPVECYLTRGVSRKAFWCLSAGMAICHFLRVCAFS